MPRSERRLANGGGGGDGGSVNNGDDDEAELGVLEDKTEALTLRSKRTERNRKKQSKKASESRARAPEPGRLLLGLPSELLLEVLSLLRPSDVFALLRTNRALRGFVQASEDVFARAVVARRYACLAKCYRAPVLLEDVPAAHCAHLLSPDRLKLQALQRHPRPYQHVAPPDPYEVCTCLTCLLRWSSLCFVVDFARWQGHLDRGEPIPAIPRRADPEWNRRLVDEAAGVVRRALRSPLWHARLLEAQLSSTVRAVARHAANKGNRRRRFRMSAEDAAAGTDEFLERSGQPTFDFPYHRDNYYMLETYMPGRSWIAEHKAWAYLTADTHDKDLEGLARWARVRQEQAAAASARVDSVPEPVSAQISTKTS